MTEALFRTEPYLRETTGTVIAHTPEGGVVLDRRTRMAYDAKHLFINGESFLASGRDAQLMRLLADGRVLGAASVNRLSAPARELVQDWLEAGWIHGDDGH